MENTAFDLEKAFSKELYVGLDGFTLPYRLYLPRDYDCGENYPLLLFLHGAGERGFDNSLQLQVGLPHLFDNPASPVYGSLVVVPQCPEEKRWVETDWGDGNYSTAEVPESRQLEAVIEVLARVIREYNVDTSRIYVTGISMGGFGTWDILARHNEIFAAGVAVCGGGDPSKAQVLAGTPIKIFHGAKDGAVPVEGSREMYSAILECGIGNISYTEYSDMDHGIWDTVYSNTDLAKWLYSKKKSAPKANKKKAAVKPTEAKGGSISKKTAGMLGIIGATAIGATALVLTALKKGKKK